MEFNCRGSPDEDGQRESESKNDLTIRMRWAEIDARLERKACLYPAERARALEKGNPIFICLNCRVALWWEGLGFSKEAVTLEDEQLRHASPVSDIEPTMERAMLNILRSSTMAKRCSKTWGGGRRWPRGMWTPAGKRERAELLLV